MKLSRNDYLLALGIVLLLLVGIFMIKYYFNYQNNECFNNPLVYGAKQIEDTTTGYFSGWGSLKNSEGMVVTNIYFNSSNSEVVHII